MIGVLILAILVMGTAGEGSVHMTLFNHAGAPIELWWINTFVPDRPLVLQTSKPVRNATSTDVNSYETHEFLVKFFNNSDSPQGHFIKGPKEEEVHVHYDASLDQFQIKVMTDLDHWVEKMDISSAKCINDNSMKFSECLAVDVQKEFTKLSEEHRQVMRYREEMSRLLRNYTCADTSLNTSVPINRFVYTFGDVEYKVNTHFDLPSAKIWTIPAFLTDDECEVFRQHAFGKLKSATVVGADGRGELSRHRKAQDAHYDIPIDYPEGDPLWPLYSRIIDFANTYGNLSVQFEGQESFTVIQYNPNDQYLPRNMHVEACSRS